VADEWDIARIRTESGDENAHFVDGPVKASIYARQEGLRRGPSRLPCREAVLDRATNGLV